MVISILDSGPGIPEEIKDRLFQLFITTKKGGSGLGLFSAKRIVEAHGGHIEIESFEGKGTLVKIYLPYKEEPEEEKKEEPIPSEGKKEAFTQVVKILMMEDEKDLREALEELLKLSGYEVISCERGEEAIELYQKLGPFDVVILDLTVPGKYDGIQTFLELKKIDPEIRAILATGYAFKSETIDAKSIGFKEVLIKPFPLEELLQVLEKITR
ncbi:MAG: response regulator [Caldimicrobium sp.]